MVNVTRILAILALCSTASAQTGVAEIVTVEGRSITLASPVNFDHTITTDGPSEITITPIAPETGRPLPTITTWGTGENQTAPDDAAGAAGFSPDWQHAQLLAGKHVLPAFEVIPAHNYQTKGYYYEPCLSHCAADGLPLSLVSQNIADMFRVCEIWKWGKPDYATIPEADHPWIMVQNPNGTKSINRVTSPWGSVKPWYELGTLFGGMLRDQFAGAYPNPPVVYLMDNGEAGQSGFGDNYALSLTDYRAPAELKLAHSAIQANPTLSAAVSVSLTSIAAAATSAVLTAARFIAPRAIR